nr:membrane-spanning 4-domains subfamily A member 12-like [Zootoca vivipara]
MIGLVHIGFGAVSLVLISYYQYMIFAAFGGYPFWAGLFFIISGSLAVSVEKYLNTSMVKCCVGMNITSSIMALIGIVLYLMELCLNAVRKDRYYPNQDKYSHEVSEQVPKNVDIVGKI